MIKHDMKVGETAKLCEIPYGSIVEMADGGLVEVLETNYGAYKPTPGQPNRPYYRIRSDLSVTSVRIRQGLEGGLADPDQLVTMREPGRDRDLSVTSGTVMRVIGGKHVGKVGIVTKTVHQGGNVALVSPEWPDEIIRVRASLVQRVSGSLVVNS